MERDEPTLATAEQFVAGLPARETDTVHFRCTDGAVVVARVTHSIELVRTYRPEAEREPLWYSPSRRRRVAPEKA